ncbi:MAG: hypothetical protein Q4G04_00580, partial [bacterium]|nr:hypothetical protein [bacterium]
MNNEFKKEFFETRDDSLKEIKISAYNWNKFLNYWANILDEYSVDNVLNLYSYNPYGKVFKSFDDWNSKDIERRIKPKSKGIPILKDDYKNYVFDIRQTYGRDYNEWKYRHQADIEILSYYQDRYNIENNSDITQNENYYNLFNQMALDRIEDNYIDMNDKEVKFIGKTISSLLLSKLNFNIYTITDSFNYINDLSDEDILKCMQISNKETKIIYDDFCKNAKKLISIKEEISKTVLDEYKSNDFMPNSDKEGYLQVIELNTGVDYELLSSIYNYYISRYTYINKNKRTDDKITLIEETSEDNIDDNLVLEKDKEDVFSEREQLSLFESREETLANKICDIFNSFDTKYQNTFGVSNVEVARWEHISSKKRNLTILLNSPIASEMGEDSFTYFNTDKTDEKKLNDYITNNAFLNPLMKDKDFSISFT